MSVENKSSKALCIQYAEEGILGSAYTEDKWFVKLKPILSLDGKNEFAKNRPSILFAFVEKGKQGNGFDIYVDIDRFDNWADDVLSVNERFKKIIEMERQNKVQYPTTYKYITGSNGEKSVGFAPANKGFAVINGMTIKDGKKVYANIPVDYDWIKTVFKKYRRVSRAYLEMLAQQTLKNSVAQWKKPQNENDMQEPEPGTTKVSVSENSLSESVPEKEEPPVSEPSYASQKLTVKNTTPLKKLNNGGGFALQGKINGNGETKNIIFLNDSINKMEPGKWENFSKAVSSKSNRFSGIFLQNANGTYIFQKFYS